MELGYGRWQAETGYGGGLEVLGEKGEGDLRRVGSDDVPVNRIMKLGGGLCPKEQRTDGNDEKPET